MAAELKLAELETKLAAMTVKFDEDTIKKEKWQREQEEEREEMNNTLERLKLEMNGATDTLRKFKEKEIDLMDNLTKKFTELEIKAGFSYSQQEQNLGAAFNKLWTDADIAFKDRDSKHEKVAADLQELYNGLQMKFQEVDQKMQQRGSGGGEGKKRHTFLPEKMMVPNKYSDNIEEWRKWKDDVSKYFDEGQEGIKAIMDEVAKSTIVVDVHELRRVAQTHPHTVQDLEKWKHLYRAIEKLVEGEAAKVVSTVPEENGFEAWRQLHLRFEPELEAQKNTVLLELHNIAPAGSIDETKTKMVELRVRIAKAENILGEILQPIQKKTAMLQILDPVTRQFVAAQGALNFVELYTGVMKFANNASSTGGGAMQKANAVKETMKQTPGDKADDDNGGDEPDYNGLNAFNGRCYICNQFGHTQWECKKGSGKGGEKGKGGGKGGGKAAGPCWTCGGAHLQRDCKQKGFGSFKGDQKGYQNPGFQVGGKKGQGKGWSGYGKGGKGLNMLADSCDYNYDYQYQHGPEGFCFSLKTVKPNKTQIQNMFQALETHEDILEVTSVDEKHMEIGRAHV